MSQPIVVHLHEPSDKETIASVLPYESVQVLESYVTGNDRRYICFHGSVLSTAFSFQFYGIKEGDHLYVLRAPKRQRPAFAYDEQISQSAKRQSVCIGIHFGNSSVPDRFFLNPGLTKEYARLIDLGQSRIDGLRTHFQGAFSSRAASSEGEQRADTIINASPKFDVPSTESLPFLWKDS